jgi:hypothetical protein
MSLVPGAVPVPAVFWLPVPGETARWITIAPGIGRRGLIELPDDSLRLAAGRLRLSCVIRCSGRSDGQVGVHDSLPT